MISAHSGLPPRKEAVKADLEEKLHLLRGKPRRNGKSDPTPHWSIRAMQTIMIRRTTQLLSLLLLLLLIIIMIIMITTFARPPPLSEWPLFLSHPPSRVFERRLAQERLLRRRRSWPTPSRSRRTERQWQHCSSASMTL